MWVLGLLAPVSRWAGCGGVFHLARTPAPLPPPMPFPSHEICPAAPTAQRRGWYCFDRASCEHRWHQLRPLMTSQRWPETRQVGGILSPDPEENPHWWTANHVFVPYCSSDSWAGTRRAADGSGEFSFMGSVIVEKVIEQLLALNLTHGHKLILAGSSAGGVGALVNVDRVAAQLARQGIRAEVRAVADSGWFLDNEPFAPLKCVDAHSCPPVEAIRRGQELWRGRIPDACAEQYPRHPWYCYFGYRLYETMKAPLFIFQWVFDEAQMTADNVGKPISKEQWDYIHSIGERLRKTFENVTALFAPSCISHTVLTKRDWSSVKIGEVSLPQALYCWDITPAAALHAKSSSGRHHVRIQLEEHHHDPAHHFGHDRHDSHHDPSSGERERDGRRKSIRRRNNSERDREDGRRRRGRGKKSRRKTQEESGQSEEDLTNTRAGGEQDSHSSSKKSHRKTSRRQSQGAGRPGVLNREMLADSPRDSSKGPDKHAAPPYLVESNAIDTTQESTKLKQQQEEAEKREDDKKELTRKERRRRRRKKKNRNKGRKKRKRNKKRGKKRNRRQRNKDKTRKKKRKSKVSSEAETVLGDAVRQARSIALLHSKQTSLHHSPPSSTTESPPSHHHHTMSPLSLTIDNPSSFSSSSSSPSSSSSSSSSSTTFSDSPPSPATHTAPSRESGEDLHEEMCPANTLHLTDRCAWPQCNYACPILLNPFTGEEMNFIELLKSFGLDMASVANALGIDIHTLNSMANDELLHILTQ
ncbi:palmitoleoyl-protein carboxylesterase NOTUM-like [Penaeus indicus]|uniref:palmitoleoyl-protein carboxylesterase NOTUM-like n=1 Tax=Penaeus indicus TaxID=29960 RepID=UPI00300D97D5